MKAWLPISQSPRTPLRWITSPIWNQNDSANNIPTYNERGKENKIKNKHKRLLCILTTWLVVRRDTVWSRAAKPFYRPEVTRLQERIKEALEPPMSLADSRPQCKLPRSENERQGCFWDSAPWHWSQPLQGSRWWKRSLGRRLEEH